MRAQHLAVRVCGAASRLHHHVVMGARAHPTLDTNVHRTYHTPLRDHTGRDHDAEQSERNASKSANVRTTKPKVHQRRLLHSARDERARLRNTAHQQAGPRDALYRFVSTFSRFFTSKHPRQQSGSICVSKSTAAVFVFSAGLGT